MTHRFTTLSGIKREAKTRSRTLGIPHTKALDEISREDGYSNYIEAKNKLTTIPPAGHKIRVWQRYRDDHGTHKGGMVEGAIFVQRPPSFYMNRKTRQALRFGLNKTRGQELYEISFVCTGRDAAQEYVGMILRAIQFSEITGFLPSAKSSIHKQHGYEKQAWCDHQVKWEHFETGDVLFTEAPYPSRLARHGTGRKEWAAAHGYNISDCEWGCVYSQYTEMILISPVYSEISLDTVLQKLRKANPPIQVLD